MRDGLPLDKVRHVVQTRDGFIWLATFNGLAQFDGVQFRTYTAASTPELRNNFINVLCEDSRGRLWIGNDTGEIAWRDRDGFHAVRLPPDWPLSPVEALAEGRDGVIWVLSQAGGVASIREGGVCQPLRESGRPRGYRFLVADQQREIWLLRRDDTVAHLQAEGEITDAGCPSPNSKVRMLFGGKREGLWVLADDRLRRWHGGEWVEDRGVPAVGPVSHPRGMETSDGRVVLCRQTNGVVIVNRTGEEDVIDASAGLGHEWASAVAEDREGNVWAGTLGGGLTMVRHRHVEMIRATEGWAQKGVASVTPSLDGGVWVGAEGPAVYKVVGNQVVQSVPFETDLPNIRTLIQDRSGAIWAGTSGRGLFQSVQDGFQPVKLPFPSAGVVCALLETQAGELWVGTQTGPLRHSSSGWLSLGQELKSPDVRCLAEDAEGAIWLGMRGGGAARWKKGAWQQYFAKDGLPSGTVSALFAEADGTVWLGTAGGGLVRWRAGKFAVLSSADGLPGDFVCHITADANQDLWLSTYAGIVRLQRAALEGFFNGVLTEIDALVLDTSEGLATTEMAAVSQPTGCRTPDGRLWFATTKGLAVLHPTNPPQSTLPPLVALRELTADGTALPIGELVFDRRADSDGTLEDNPPPDGAVLPPGVRRVQIQFSGLSFASPQRVRFKYRLLGLDQNWVDGGTERTAAYNDLPPGAYEFQLLAANSQGVWNTNPGCVGFRVPPRFWQTWWFVPACWLGGLSLSAAVVARRVRHRQKLRVQALERSRALERERGRIAQDLHDDLGTGLTEISSTATLGQGENIPGDESREYFREINQRSREMVAALDEIVWAVNPSNDTVSSLATYLSQFAQQFFQRAQVRCRFDVSDHLEALPLDADKRHNLFLAFKEAINNVVRHAGASEVTIASRVEGGLLTVSVKDNGCGCPPAEIQSGGNGLQNMRQRLEVIGGRCDIFPVEGGGTEVRFTLPISPAPGGKAAATGSAAGLSA